MSAAEDRDSRLFRAEAVLHHEAGQALGAPLRISPRWIGHAVWLLVAMVATGAALATFCRMGTFAEWEATLRADGGGGFTAVATMPARDVSVLRVGSRLRLEHVEPAGTYRDLEVTRTTRVIAADGAARLVLEARLPGVTPVGDARRVAYFDGMPVRLRTNVGSERIVFVLFPGLRRWLETP